MRSVEENRIISFIYSLKKRFFQVATIHFLLDFFIFSSGIFYLFLIASHTGIVSGAKLFFYFIFVLFLFLTARYFYDLKKFCKTDSLIMYVQNKYPQLLDHLSNSYSFISKPPHVYSEISESLKQSHIVRTVNIINTLSIKEIIPFRLKNKLLLLTSTVLVTLIFYVVLPTHFAYALYNLCKKPVDISQFKISPKNCEVLFGDSVVITLMSPHNFPHRPALFVRVANEKLQEVELSRSDEADGVIWSFNYDGVFADTKYFFKLGTMKTEEYKISVIKPVMFEEIIVQYHYPDYTGVPPKTTKNEPNLDCYEGTKISLTARATEKITSAEIFFDGNRDSKKTMKIAKDELFASVSFTVLRESSYKFRIVAKNAKEFFTPSYNINILRDAPPRVDILSPAQDVVAASDDTLAVIYSCQDDFGIASVKLVYKIGQEEKMIPLMKRVNKKEIIEEYNLRIASLKPVSDEIISYYIVASDAKGNEGFSKTYRIEIASYEKFHQEIMSDLRGFSDELLKLLSAQSVVYEKYRDKIPPDWEELKRVQNEIYEKTKKASERLSEILKKMQEDPFFDGYLLNEYQGIKSALDYLKDKPLNSIREKIHQKDFPAVQNFQQEAISIFEKISLLSEDVWKYQNYSDLEMRFASLEKRFDASLENFEQKGIEELLEDMREISEIINEIQKLMETMPAILPEEFVNSEAIKDIDITSAQDVVSGIMDALSRSDMTTAKKMMQKLKTELKKMRDAMKKASENLAIKSAPSDISGRISAVAQKLNDILKKQKNLYDATAKLDSVRQKKLFELQEILLKELAEKQKALNQKAQDIKNSVAGVVSSLPLMEKIYAELSSGRVHHSQKFLEDVITNFSNLRTAFLNKEDKKEELTRIEEILNGEKEILSQLRTSPKVNFSQSEKNTLDTISKKQSSLRDELKSAKNDLLKITKETAAVSYDVLNRLTLADAEMLSSSENLSVFETGKSLENQKNVIDLLSHSSEQMESSASGMGRMSFGQKPAPSLKTTSQSGSGGGMYGVKIQRVELPSVEDYKVPPEFREEILKALLEKYPEEYEKIIHRYYRNLIGQ